jgi:excisionase family DNA binding protein
MTGALVLTSFFTTTTAAVELGVTPGRVRAMIAAGRLQATLAGRDWLIERQSLDAVRDRKPGRPPLMRRKAARRDDLKIPRRVMGGQAGASASFPKH